LKEKKTSLFLVPHLNSKNKIFRIGLVPWKEGNSDQKETYRELQQ
jgi:hypothetical protein